MFLNKGKVWINGVEHSFRSKVSPDGVHLVFSDLPTGSYAIWIGVGRGKGCFRSKKITVNYDGNSVNLRCSAAVSIVSLFGLLAFPFANTFYKLKRL